MFCVAGIDPGGIIGFGVVRHLSHNPEPTWSVATFTDVEPVFHAIRTEDPDVVVIEDYNSAGPVTREAKQVFIQIGAVMGFCLVTQQAYVIVQSGARIRNLEQARERILKRYDRNTINLVQLPHAADGLAHAFSELERRGRACPSIPPTTSW